MIDDLIKDSLPRQAQPQMQREIARARSQILAQRQLVVVVVDIVRKLVLERETGLYPVRDLPGRTTRNGVLPDVSKQRAQMVVGDRVAAVIVAGPRTSRRGPAAKPCRPPPSNGRASS